MAIQAVTALRGTLLQFVSLVEELGNNYFRDDHASFPARVRLLQVTHDGLQERLERYGLCEGTSMSVHEAMREAQKLLDGEIAKLQKKKRESQASSWIDYSVCKFLRLFPMSVDRHIGVVEGAYARLIDHFKTQPQIDDVFSEITRRQAFLLPFHNDSRYVPLEISEAKVFSALERAGQAVAVVLLSGGPGKGKSTLARHVSLLYKSRKLQFTQVIMWIAAKQAELLQKLGGGLSEQLEGDTWKVCKALQSRLNHPKTLIVLDDVWEAELIGSLVNLSQPHCGAKYLVTSQLGNVCVSVNCPNTTLVAIEDLTQVDARRILASHAGIPNQCIPDPFTDIADRVADQAEQNPLVLATLGARIAKAGVDRLDVWENISNHLIETLDSDTEVYIHGIKYPKSFWATMTSSANSLSPKQKYFLVLIGMCRGPSTPVSVFQFLLSRTVLQQRNNVLDFLELSSELESRNLIFEKDRGSLSTHSLTKTFIRDKLRDTVKYIANLLSDLHLEPDVRIKNSVIQSEYSVINVLAYLYIDTDFNNRARLLVEQSLDLHRGKDVGHINIERKRNIIEPIVQLVIEATKMRTGGKLCASATQVLLNFVQKNSLDQGAISMLLTSSTSVFPVMTFLQNVCLLQESFWKKNFIQNTSSIPLGHSLLKVLKDHSRPDHQTIASMVLVDLCVCHENNAKTIVSVPGILSQLALLPPQAQNSELERNFPRAVSACAYWDSDTNTIGQSILDVPGLLKSLVDLMAKHKSPGVQNDVAHALYNLASGKDTIKNTLVRQPGVLEGLVKSLIERGNPHLQKNAASTLANMASTDDCTTLENLFNHSGLVDKLIRSLLDDQNPFLQSQAARAFSNLVRDSLGNNIRNQIVQLPRLLEALARSLLEAQNPSLQKFATITIYRLAVRAEKKTTDTISAYPGLVNSLVQMLVESENFTVREPAVIALCNLTYVGDDNLRAKIANSPRLLERLSESLLKGANPEFEGHVVCLLANMAVTKDRVILDKIIYSPGLVEKLAKALATDKNLDQNSCLQVNAALVLLNLAGDEDNNNYDMSCFPALLQRLTKALLRGENLALRETVTMSLAFFTAKKEESKDHGVNTSDLLYECLK